MMTQHRVTLESPTSIEGISTHRTVTIWADTRQHAKARAIGKCKKNEYPIHAQAIQTNREWQC